MRDWLLIAAPFGAALYFLLYPDQFRAVTDWLAHLF